MANWQSDSDYKNILYIASVPILFASGLSDDAVIKIGVENAIIGGQGSDMKYVEHSGAAISAMKLAIDDMEMRM